MFSTSSTVDNLGYSICNSLISLNSSHGILSMVKTDRANVGIATVSGANNNSDIGFCFQIYMRSGLLKTRYSILRPRTSLTTTNGFPKSLSTKLYSIQVLLYQFRKIFTFNFTFPNTNNFVTCVLNTFSNNWITF